jgi:hypothetical protein
MPPTPFLIRTNRAQSIDEDGHRWKPGFRLLAKLYICELSIFLPFRTPRSRLSVRDITQPHTFVRAGSY